MEKTNYLVPSTQVQLSNGSVKNIDKIKVGDDVITHLNRFKKVTKTFSCDYSGDLYEIKNLGNIPLLANPDCSLYLLGRDSVRSGVSFDKETIISRKFANIGNYCFEFRPISILKKGYSLISPIIKTEIESDITPVRARLLGLWAAEGSFSKKYGKRQAIRYTFGIHEDKLANFIQEGFEEEFPECSVKITKEPIRSVITVTATGHNIAEYFYYHIGEYSHEKILSSELVFGQEDVKKNFLMGWMEGDGCQSTGEKIITITVSPHLAWQSRLMMNSLGARSNVRRPKNREKVKIHNDYGEYFCYPHYRIELNGSDLAKLNIESLRFNVSKHLNCLNFFVGDYNSHLIKLIQKQPCNGKLYGLEVEEDHSFVANGVLVHD